jgi:ferredoxin-like protein FixX
MLSVMSEYHSISGRIEIDYMACLECENKLSGNNVSTFIIGMVYIHVQWLYKSNLTSVLLLLL